MKFVPRPYQLKAHEMLIKAFRALVYLLVMMPTGTGKTKTMVSFMQKYPHYKFVIVVKGRDLVFQFAEAVNEFELNHGLFMSGEDMKIAPIQVCSIDTIAERKWFPFFDETDDLVIFIDEADETVSEGYGEFFKMIKQRKGRTFVAGFTATAFDHPLPLFHDVVVPITNNEAREIGALVDFQYFVPKLVDFEEFRVLKGEFIAKDVETKFNTPEIVKHNFEDWLRFGDNRQTLIFATCKEHAERFKEYINNYYGRTVAEIITADVSKKDRKEHYKNFGLGYLRFLISIRIVTRGVDIPEIGCILDCSPTMSTDMHIQKLGRGSRPGFYENCIIIDAANNCILHGPFYDYPREINLKEKKKKPRKKSDTVMHLCLTCYRASLKTLHTRQCPYCKTPYIIKEVKLTSAEKKKQILENATPAQILQMKMINEFKQMLWKRTNLPKQYSVNIDIQKGIVDSDTPRIKAQKDLIAKYGLTEVRKIAKSIGLK